MQYTLRRVPEALDRALREKARAEGRSLDDVALECLMRALGLDEEPVRHRRLGDVAGTWQADPEVDAALAEQRRIDPDDWR
jgi:plasmid stability protein